MAQEDIRTYGVSNADDYWQKRENKGDTAVGRLHKFLAATIGELAGPGGAALDCGAGSGHVFRLCQDKQEMYGVDLSGFAIEEYGFPPERLRKADLNDGIPDFGIKFDVILASMLLHWLDEPALFIKRAMERIKPDGHVMIVIPNITYYTYRIGYIFGTFPPISLSHKNFQTPTEFERMVGELDVHVVKRTSPKKKLRAKWWPTLFSQDIVYILKPGKAK